MYWFNRTIIGWWFVVLCILMKYNDIFWLVNVFLSGKTISSLRRKKFLRPTRCFTYVANKSVTDDASINQIMIYCLWWHYQRGRMIYWYVSWILEEKMFNTRIRFSLIYCECYVSLIKNQVDWAIWKITILFYTCQLGYHTTIHNGWCIVM